MNDWLTLVLVGLPLVVAAMLAIVDVIRRSDLGTFRITIWIVALVLMQPVAVVVYVLVRPLPEDRKPSTDSDGSARAELLVEAAERHQRDEIDDGEFRTVVAAIDR